MRAVSRTRLKRTALDRRRNAAAVGIRFVSASLRLLTGWFRDYGWPRRCGRPDVGERHSLTFFASEGSLE